MDLHPINQESMILTLSVYMFYSKQRSMLKTTTKKLVALKAVRVGWDANSKQTNDRNNGAVHKV